MPFAWFLPLNIFNVLCPSLSEDSTLDASLSVLFMLPQIVLEYRQLKKRCLAFSSCPWQRQQLEQLMMFRFLSMSCVFGFSEHTCHARNEYFGTFHALHTTYLHLTSSLAMNMDLYTDFEVKVPSRFGFQTMKPFSIRLSIGVSRILVLSCD